MEWVEKTGRSVEEAKERALEQLGVSEKDAELVVLAEPKTGLFGRVRGEARVRARVRPAEPRPKRSRRQRDRQHGAIGNGSRGITSARPSSVKGRDEPAPAGQSASSRRRRRRRSAAQKRVASGNETASGRGSAEMAGQRRAEGAGKEAKEEHAVADGITLQEQGAVAKEFLEGLLDRYGLEARVDVRELDEETVELAAHGEGLGVLVGPKGATVTALQDVTRTVVQKHFPNRTDRILVDVAGYRERRVAALRRFTTEVAADVLEFGSERALEPMSAADRKVVHDTVVTIEGVASSSQGEEPHRFVVISPAP